jgi:hypothetical protein
MSSGEQEKTPETKPARSGGPPKPPKPAAKGLGDDSPEYANRLASAQRILRDYEENARGPKLTPAQRERFIRIFTHPDDPIE